ncbi:MAG: hypothetical protein LBQ80_05175 [Clostridium sp.]|jgi:endogenous inhibitor of DNA gyrase (YacG/DUF329 family)|nr:hypothetical protein [Clostridium sp.]
MTQTQKNDIERLREEGFPYSAISERLGINMSTVKSYCLRNGKGKKPKQLCKQCNKLLPPSNNPNRKFCSTQCRMTWWHKHPEDVTQGAVYEYMCPVCGKPFSAYGNKKRIYCSAECYHIARYGAEAMAASAEKKKKKATARKQQPSAERLTVPPKEETHMDKTLAEGELAFRLIEILLSGMETEGLISKKEHKLICSLAVKEIKPLIGSLG